MKQSIRSSPPKIRIAALLAAGLMFGATQSAMAVGTQAGTTISNSATLAFTVGGVVQTPVITPTPATFVVDDKVNLTVAGGIQKSVSPGQVGALTPFTITNLGNATQGYNLIAANAVSAGYTVGTAITDNFDPAVALTIYLNTSCDGSTLNGVITTIPTLAAGATVCVVVSTTIPAAQVNGDAAVISLKATTVWPMPLVAAEEPATAVAGAVVANNSGSANTAGVDVVWADVAGVVDAATDGAHSTYGAYKIASAILSVTKVATVLCDPINGNVNPKNIPGAVVQYAVTIANATGGASATLSSVSDTLVAALGFDTKLINGAGATPATTCTSAGGTSLSASGFGAVSNITTSTTTYTAPGLAAQATTAGATQAAGVITINFGTLASPAYALAGGVLPGNSFVTVYYNAIVQ